MAARLTTTDLVGGVPAVAVAAVATVSLATAHAHAHSLPLVLALSALLLGALGLLARRSLPGVDRDPRGALACLGAGVVAAVMFLPGFSYGVADKDPGGYVAHAVVIAEHGSYSFTDPALAHPTLRVGLSSPGARLPGVAVRDGESGLIVPQFLHLWPALLATAYDIGGYGGVTAATPLVGAVAVMALVALLRRVGGLAAAVIGGALLATNMLQVWQARYPTSEALAEALFVGSLLALVVAIQSRWGPAAALAGALTGVGFLNRADGWLLVMLAAAALAAAWASRRADALVAWGAAGLALVLPYACWQAYAAARDYTRANSVPRLVPTLTLLVMAGAAGAAGRRLRWDRLGDARVQRRLGVAVCAGAASLMVVGFLRPVLFEHTTYVFRGQRQPTYDEYSLIRLGWFLTLPGFALAGLGLAVVALRRWNAAVWAAVLPALLLLPVFAWRSRNSSRLMWWARRYVPHVLPGLVVLVALALAFALVWEWRGRRPLRVPAVLATVGLVAVFLSQSLPLRGHDEFAGSFGVAERLSRLAGDARGVYLWQRPACCGTATDYWATPLWLERDELSVLLPNEPERIGPYVASYRAAFAADPVFVVWSGPGAPPVEGAVEVDHLSGRMPFWEESDVARPDEDVGVTYDFRVYRVP
ncbi:MAG TPA: hypothetical protein VGX28_00265 [Frankiaceae bacterium]|jgi:hypothetical protein|nr:hypothetical protein [Frankiaceae bacterium]